MKTSRLIFAAAVLLLGICGAIDKNSEFIVRFTGFPTPTLDFVHAVLLLVALAALIVSLVPFIAHRLITYREKRYFSNLSDSLYEERPIKQDTIREIALLDTQAFPYDETSEEEFLTLFEKNKESLRCWRLRDNRNLVGFFLISALSKASTSKILNKTYRRASDIPLAGHLKGFQRADS